MKREISTRTVFLLLTVSGLGLILTAGLKCWQIFQKRKRFAYKIAGTNWFAFNGTGVYTRQGSRDCTLLVWIGLSMFNK